MTRQKRFSKLAAAALLLTASATCFSQTDSNTSQAESIDSTVVAINNAPTLELARESSKVTPTAVDGVKATESRTILSARRFTESAKHSFLKPSVASEFRTEISNTAEFSDQSKAKRVEFVPSRSPRLPW